MQIWSAEIKELEKLYESLKGQLPDLEKELERLIKADDENMILLYSRRYLEVIITGLCECELKRDRGTEPLKGIIDKLNKEKKIPAHIIASMHGLNELSTFGTHPKDFDPEQVKPVLNNLDIIIKWYLKYSESRSIDKIKEETLAKENITLLNPDEVGLYLSFTPRIGLVHFSPSPILPFSHSPYLPLIFARQQPSLLLRDEENDYGHKMVSDPSLSQDIPGLVCNFPACKSPIP